MQYNYTGYGGPGGGGGFGGQGQQQQQQQQPGYGGGGAGMGMGNSFLSSQQTGFPGMQQPMQTGFRPSPQPTGNGQAGGNYSFLNSQPTGYGGGGNGGLASQMTGFAGGGASGLMPMLTGAPGGMGGGGGAGMMPQQTGHQGGMMPQQTGFQGGGLRAQPTGMHDPRLQSMMQSFMPSNMSQPLNNQGAPQFAQTSTHLTQQFQSLLDNPKIRTPKVPWTLSKQEKKDYDQIFRAWDVTGEGFISGEMAREVFGQSGLGQNDLIKIWNLSDVHNRGKLNLPEFHVAMGMIYRALNGNDIPEELPEELVPASMRDIDSTVNFMRDLLKHDSSARSGTSSPGGLSDPRFSSAASAKDAKVYKHVDTPGGGYKPSSRHLDRKSVRHAGEDPDAEISDLRRQLENTSMMLDRSAADSARKSDEDEKLEQEVDDLKYRVKRLQEDIDYVSKGRRSADKDEERRKLERELLFLMHEKLPELERRQKVREDEKRMEERAGVRQRDRRNESHSRYDGGERDRERESGGDWLRGSYDRDRGDRDRRDRDRDDHYRRDDRDRRDRSRSRSRDREYRPRTPPADRAPPPAPPPAPAAAAPPAPPAPATKAQAAPSTKGMTPEERSAFIRAQAQARIQERLRALGVESAAPEAAAVDTSVQERLDREKREAEEQSKKAEEDQKAREEARRKKLQGAGASPVDDKPAESAATAAPAPAPSALKSAMKKPAQPPAPPTSRSAKVAPTPPAPKAPPKAPSPAPPASAPVAEEDPEEAEMRQKEEARAKAREDRRARLAALEAEEEEERKREEELLAARKTRSTGPSPAPPAVSEPTATSPPPPPPAPPAPAAASGGGYNPFRKPSGAGPAGSPAASAASPAQAGGAGAGFNPFFRPPPASSPASQTQTREAAAVSASTPPPPPPPAPPAPAFRPPPVEDDWEQIHEKSDNDSDSSDDDDYAHSRTQRGQLASALFGGLGGGAGGSRPGSAGPGSPARATPPAALAKLGGGEIGGGGMGALLGSIQAGSRLKKTQTVVKGVATGGKVVGDGAPPAHIGVAPQAMLAASPAPMEVEAPREVEVEEQGKEDDEDERNRTKRQSVDWYAGLAADQAETDQRSRLGSMPAASFAEGSTLDATREEDEGVNGGDAGAAGGAGAYGTPEVRVQEDLDEFDLSTELRVRSVYPYEGQRDVDLSFAENVVILANPAKDAESPWWYGTVVKSGEKGWFPHNYVAELKAEKARALFPYEGGEADQLPFLEGDELVIVDSSDADWWKTEKAGVIFLVPAAFLEMSGEASAPTNPEAGNRAIAAAATDLTPGITPTPQSSTANDSPALDAGFLSPVATPSHGLAASPSSPVAQRLRSGTINSVYSASSAEEGYESSDDSMLSWWSSDEEDEDVEGEDGEAGGAGAGGGGGQDADKEAERKRREAERMRMLSSAGLQLRREPPPPPTSRIDKDGDDAASGVEEAGKTRRPAPAAPKRRRRAPAVPQSQTERASGGAVHGGDEYEEGGERAGAEAGEVEVQDAYARYEKFLAQQSRRPTPGRADSASASRPVSTMSPSLGITPQVTGPGLAADASTPLSVTPSAQGQGQGQAAPVQKEGRLQGFISRMKASTPMAAGGLTGGSTEGRKIISGPIVRVGNGSGTDTPQSADGVEGGAMGEMGKTWSSLVDKEVLGTMGDKERKRQEAIYEFITTEAAYNRDLQLIVNVFYASMLPLLDEKAQTVIFANIEDILLFNTSFLSSLEDRQKACRLYIDQIGDILESNARGMGVYEAYCVNQQNGERVLRGLRAGDDALDGHLKAIRESSPEVRGLDLSSFLLIPMQRITRYPLLLKQIAHYTEPDQDLVSVQHALGTIEGIVANINESIREAESYERLRVLSEDLWVGGEGRIDLTAPTAYQGPRRLLKEGSVSKTKSGRKLLLVLCTDILLLIESRNLYRMPVPLFELAIREGRDGVSFAIKVDRSRGGDTIGLKAPSAREAREWLGLIERQRMRTIEARMKVHSGFAQY